jgi:hypothetical protein
MTSTGAPPDGGRSKPARQAASSPAKAAAWATSGGREKKIGRKIR